MRPYEQPIPPAPDHRPDPPADLIRLSKAARILCVSLPTAYRWALGGRLRYWKVCQMIRVSEADVRALLVRGRVVRPKAPPPLVPSARAVAARNEYTRRVLAAHGLASPELDGGAGGQGDAGPAAG